MERRSVTERLITENASDTSGARQEKEKLTRVLRNASPNFDAGGHPVLRMVISGEVESVGVTESNILANDALSPNFEKFQEQLLEKRLQEELRRGAPQKVSESDVARDWQLLQRAMNESDDQLAARSAKLTQPSSQARTEGTGNRP